MAHFETPDPLSETVKSLSDFLRIIGEWQAGQHPSSSQGFLSQLWYRGVNQHFPTQAPGVYRHNFTTRAQTLYTHESLEERRLRLEREMLSQFRTAGAVFLEHRTPVEAYFAAQHFGMPTRLLDWSTNPLAALFFACEGKPDNDGAIYAMDARQVIAQDAMKTGDERLYQSVMTMRHKFVEYAVSVSLWSDQKTDIRPHVLPIRPDSMPGRIGQQSSCFTLHMHNAKPANNETMVTIRVDGPSKDRLLIELHRLNINRFTTYYDLDHLSKEIKSSWGLGSV
jgi:hypothetical protein